MRIDPNVVVSPVTSATAERREAPGKTNPPTPSAVVVLSSAAAKIAPEPAASPATTQRLGRIRELLDAGEYPVDLDKLAARIVDDEIARSRGPRG